MWGLSSQEAQTCDGAKYWMNCSESQENSVQKFRNHIAITFPLFRRLGVSGRLQEFSEFQRIKNLASYRGKIGWRRL
jgi:hypothetical protein